MEFLEAEGCMEPVTRQDHIYFSVYMPFRDMEPKSSVVLCGERFVTFFVNYCVVYLLFTYAMLESRIKLTGLTVLV